MNDMHDLENSRWFDANGIVDEELFQQSQATFPSPSTLVTSLDRFVDVGSVEVNLTSHATDVCNTTSCPPFLGYAIPERRIAELDGSESHLQPQSLIQDVLPVYVQPSTNINDKSQFPQQQPARKYRA